MKDKLYKVLISSYTGLESHSPRFIIEAKSKKEAVQKAIKENFEWWERPEYLYINAIKVDEIESNTNEKSSEKKEDQKKSCTLEDLINVVTFIHDPKGYDPSFFQTLGVLLTLLEKLPEERRKKVTHSMAFDLKCFLPRLFEVNNAPIFWLESTNNYVLKEIDKNCLHITFKNNE